MKAGTAGFGNPGPQTSSAVASVLDRLFALKAHGAKFGIDRMRALAAALGQPERRVPCLHVAGTNGKGSVAAMLDSILRAAGWRCGLYTSPHLVHVGERVQVDRQALTDAEILAYVAELQPVAERIAADDADLAPTFFEYMTAMAFLQFARRHCDVAVIEVGLGGRLDATNVVQPEVSIITSIGLDHCELLGHTLTQIAGEKAGIIRPGVPVVIGHMPREAEKVIRATAAQVGAPAISVAERFGGEIGPLPQTNLEGDYQRWNAATATLAAQALAPRWRISADALARGFAHVDWPGRWQRVTVAGRQVILDASHNPEGAETLDQNLRRLVQQTGRAPVVVTGVLGTARAQPLVEAICRHAGEVHLVVPHQPRACSYSELEALVPGSYSGRVVRNAVETIFPEAGGVAIGSPEDLVVVTGSIYLIGEVMRRLVEQSRRGAGQAITGLAS